MADKPKKMSIPPEYRLRVKQRLAIVTYAVAHGLLPASRRFSLDRKTIREWRDRWQEHALLGSYLAIPSDAGRVSPTIRVQASFEWDTAPRGGRW